MDYHYETQPIPNPLSRRLHHMPKAWHRFETFFGLWVVEMFAPLLLMLPGGGLTPFGAVGLLLRRMSSILQIVFQFVLILSGNLSFLNWLTIAPAIMCLDDAALLGMLPWATADVHQASAVVSTTAWAGLGSPATLISQGALAVLLLRCSLPVVRNMLSPKQRMNAAFGAWRFVNSYGAFGSVTKQRLEVQLEGTTDNNPYTATWLPYEFIAKPGDKTRAPRWLSPWHLRLDWLMWFLPFASYERQVWLKPLVQKLLENDKEVSRLLDRNPFLEQGEPPKWVRANLWRYSFVKPEHQDFKHAPYWKTQFVGEYMPPFSNQTLWRYR